MDELLSITGVESIALHILDEEPRGDVFLHSILQDMKGLRDGKWSFNSILLDEVKIV